MLYRKLKRVHSHQEMNYIPKFREIFPELNKLTSEELYERWLLLEIDFYTENYETVKPWIRITLPFAIILMAVMIITSPIKFIITGIWHYNFSKKNYIYNWFKQLKLL